MPEWLTLTSAIVAPLIITGGGLLVARRYARLGGGEAQVKLNTTLRGLADAYEEKLALRDGTLAEMRTEMDACKTRLEAMERAEHKWRAERLDLKQEVGDLHDELREVRRAIKGDADA